MEAIDHLDLVVSSLERSLPFYRRLLGPLGYVHEGDIASECGERVLYLSRHGGGGSVSLRERQSNAHEVPGIKLEIVSRPAERDLMRRVQELETRLGQAAEPAQRHSPADE